MQANKVTIIALIMAGAALGVALVSQYLFDAKPCNLCILQRYPYVAVLAFAAIAIFWGKAQRALLPLIMLAFFATSAIAAYHVGVEQGFIDAPESCATKQSKATSIEQLKAAILSTKAVSCKDAGASFAGLSMATWNMIYGLTSTFIIGYLWKKQPK